MKNMTNSKNARTVTPKKVAPKFPPGWNEAKVRAVIDHYDNLTDEERAREIEEAVEIEDQTAMAVPTEMVPDIARLIDDHQGKSSNGRAPKRRPAKIAAKRHRKPARH